MIDNLKNHEYFRKGLIEIINNDNSGYVPAFGSQIKNAQGIFFKIEDFKEIIESYNVLINTRSLPDEFFLKIKYSPISLFKKWIFIFTDEGVKDKKKSGFSFDFFRKEYFLMSINNEFSFFQISSNIAHESFLFNLYKNEKLEEHNITFQTQFNDEKKLIIYKNYEKRKINTVNLPKSFNILKNRPYQVKVSVIKNPKGARFKIKINENKIDHLIRLEKITDKAKNLELSTENESKVEKFKMDSPDKPKKDIASLNDLRKEVIKILKENHGSKQKTNKFANVSLGRVNKITVLINLSKKYQDQEITMFYNESNENFEIHIEEKLIKTFMVSYSPRSNWLEKIKVS